MELGSGLGLGLVRVRARVAAHSVRSGVSSATSEGPEGCVPIHSSAYLVRVRLRVRVRVRLRLRVRVRVRVP